MKKTIIYFITIIFIITSCAQTAPKVVNPELFKNLNKNSKILLLPLDIELYEISIGDVPIIKVDWINTATKFTEEILNEKFESRNAILVKYTPPNDKEKENQIIQLVKLNGLVTDSIHLHENNPQFKLPAKEAFEWDIGDKISLLNEFYDTDYALFINIRSYYSTSGREILAILVGAITGYWMITRTQRAYGTLVDLKSGKIQWYNRLYMEFGDMRNKKGMEQAADYILKSFPE